MFATLKRTAKLFHIPSTAELENAYVNGATDRYDLEDRQRLVDRGTFRKNYLGF